MSSVGLDPYITGDLSKSCLGGGWLSYFLIGDSSKDWGGNYEGIYWLELLAFDNTLCISSSGSSWICYYNPAFEGFSIS